MKFSKEFLQERVWEDTLQETIVDQRRWVTVMEVVFEHEGRCYITTYEKGSTEMQESSPYEYDEDEIECPEVKLVEKVVKVYEEV